jgi:hypothetical protein
MGDNLYQNYYPNIEFFGHFGRFGEIRAIKLAKTFKICLNS